jgi:hypothetical protein
MFICSCPAVGTWEQTGRVRIKPAALGFRGAAGDHMPPSSEPAANVALSNPAGEVAVVDSAAPIFGIILGTVVMIVLALNALAY